MAKTELQFTGDEKAMIVKGLKMLFDDADKVSTAAARMNITKATTEVNYFKDKITELSDKISGQKKLV